MVYAHQHLSLKNAIKSYHTPKHQPRETVTEKCSICDAMHNNNMVDNTGVYFSVTTAVGHMYKPFDYNFKSISIILSGDRGPPFFNKIS
jgi:hypothetical protein